MKESDDNSSAEHISKQGLHLYEVDDHEIMSGPVPSIVLLSENSSQGFRPPVAGLEGGGLEGGLSFVGAGLEGGLSFGLSLGLEGGLEE